MQKTMKTAVMNQVSRLDIEDHPIPSIQQDEVLVRLEYVGVCGSDLHLFEHGYIGENQVTQPMVLGHEPAGTIVKAGKNVSHLKPGDRVAVEPGIPCWKCEFCKTGRYNLCPNVFFYASLPVTQGCFTEFIAHPANLCYKLPDTVTTLEGALMEPLAVGMHAALQSHASVGKSAVILGAGCIGLVTMLALKSMGIGEIIMVDLEKIRLDKALELGATAAINASLHNTEKEVLSRTNGGADFVFETAGTETTVFQTAKLVKRGGTIVFVGYTKDGISKLNLNWIIDNEITMKTVFRYRNIYPTIIEAVSKGIIPLKKIASHIYKFKDIQQGLEHAIHNKNTVTKCIIQINTPSETIHLVKE